MLITSDSLKLIEDTKEKLGNTFKMKDMGELECFLGVEFARSQKVTLMHQRKYSLELIYKTQMSYKTCYTYRHQHLANN